MQIRQLGYVTDDIEAAAMDWFRTTGAGPFFVIKGMGFRNWSYRGQPQDMTLDIAFGQVGDLMVELIRPNGPWPNVYGDALPSGCRAHHHGYLVSDVDAAAARLEGDPITQADLSDTTELRYFDCRDRLGLFVELITDSEESRGFFDLSLAAARGWDGRTAPVRPFESAVA
nr:VOC family protein [Croceicoccus ponticola]